MKITFKTCDPGAPCSDFYINAFKHYKDVTFFDEQYANYQVALFMTYDHEKIESVKKSHPHLKIGIIDPRNYKVFPSTRFFDFIIVDSIEMEDYWRCANLPIFRYVEYPSFDPVDKRQIDDEYVRIGYHGNGIHLDCMSQNVTPALEELGEKYKLKLLVMRNGATPQPSDSWYPKNVEVEFQRWSLGGYNNFLSLSDIGIVPNNLIQNDSDKDKNSTASNFNYSKDDYSLRFKMPSNPGRIVVFGLMGIPVIADFYPSALQCLDNKNGFVAHSKDGWKYRLETLIKNPDLRQESGKRLKSFVSTEFNFTYQNQKLKHFLLRLLKR